MVRMLQALARLRLTASEPAALLQASSNHIPSGSAALPKWLVFTAALSSAFLLRFGLALIFPNVHRPDEIFQNLEPAFRMWFGGGVVTWEWLVGIRSPVFPGFIAAIIGLSTALGLGAYFYLIAVTMVMSALATGVVWVGLNKGWDRFRGQGALICGAVCATWPDLIYFGPKPLAEVQAGNLLVIAAYLATRGPKRADSDALSGRSTVRVALCAGLLLGTVVGIRPHLAPAILVVYAAAILTRPVKAVACLLIGTIVAAVAFGVVDLMYWGQFFHSFIANFKINLIERVSEEFGVQPKLWFLTRYLSIWGSGCILIGALFVAGLRLAPSFAGVAISIVISHSFIAHKEISFIYAAIPPAMVVAGLGAARIVRWLISLLPARRGGLVMTGALGFWVLTCITTSISAGFRPYWESYAATLQAQMWAGNDPDLCGLGLRSPEVFWFRTGGDVVLGRDIPIYSFETPAETSRVWGAVNYVIGGPNVADGLPGFSIKQCWKGTEGTICVARARPPKICIRDPAIEVNSTPNLGRPTSPAAAGR